MFDPISIAEIARLKALDRYAILDTDPEGDFDDLARLAAQICGTPIALVSLVDADRQWFKSGLGIDVAQTPRSQSFCDHAIRQPGLLVVPDAKTDERFAANPLVTGDPRIRFYAGTPLVTNDGYALGTLCVIDRVPRNLSMAQAEALEALGRQVVGQMELRLRIIEQRQAKEALRVSDERFTLAMRGTDDGLWDWDIRTDVIYYAPRFAELLGHEAHEIEPMLASWESRLHSEDRTRVLRAIDDHLKRRTAYDVEYRLVTKSGDYRWFRSRGQALWDENGQPSRMAGSISDITERRRDEDALRRSEAEARKLAMVASRTDNAVIITDAAGRIEWVNEGFVRITEYRLEEVLGRKPGSFLQGLGTDPETVRMIRERLAANQAFKAEIVNYSKSGREYWLAIDAQPIRDAVGVLTHFVAIESDITESKRIEGELRRAHEDLRQANDELEVRVRERTSELQEQSGALRQAEESYRGIFENAAEGIFQTTVEGRYLRANPALTRIYGFETPADLIAEMDDIGCQLYVEPGRREEFRRLVEEQGTISGFESRVRRKDGRIIWIRENARAVRRPDGVVRHYEGLVEDVTERKRAEAEIRALNTELEQSYDATIEGWAGALDLRDKETEGHSRRVTEMSLRLARVLGLGEEELIHVRRGALLHDIGKLGVPDAVLLKPGRLTEAEWDVMRRHPTYAHDWLATIPVLRPAMAIPYGHHEKWDGTGYPQGLAGDEIPLAARLFAAVDIWDALRSDRPYRKAWSETQVRDHLRSLSGTHLDPSVVKAFLQMLNDSVPGHSEKVATPFLTSERSADPLMPVATLRTREDRLAEDLKASVERVRDLERTTARLSALAATDELTGLWNRRHFSKTLGAACSGAMRHGQPLSLVLLDLDGFKLYNDTHGHPAGDEVLRSVAEILRLHVRPCDVAVRHGGEEFAVLMPATDVEGALACAERLREAIAERCWPRRPVTASFGVATMPADVTLTVDLVEQADQALYHAKRLGRDRVEHHEDLSGQPTGQLSLAV